MPRVPRYDTQQQTRGASPVFGAGIPPGAQRAVQIFQQTSATVAAGLATAGQAVFAIGLKHRDKADRTKVNQSLERIYNERRRLLFEDNAEEEWVAAFNRKGALVMEDETGKPRPLTPEILERFDDFTGDELEGLANDRQRDMLGDKLIQLRNQTALELSRYEKSQRDVAFSESHEAVMAGITDEVLGYTDPEQIGRTLAKGADQLKEYYETFGLTDEVAGDMGISPLSQAIEQWQSVTLHKKLKSLIDQGATGLARDILDGDPETKLDGVRQYMRNEERNSIDALLSPAEDRGRARIHVARIMRDIVGERVPGTKPTRITDEQLLAIDERIEGLPEHIRPHADVIINQELQQWQEAWAAHNGEVYKQSFARLKETRDYSSLPADWIDSLTVEQEQNLMAFVANMHQTAGKRKPMTSSQLVAGYQWWDRLSPEQKRNANLEEAIAKFNADPTFLRGLRAQQEDLRNQEETGDIGQHLSFQQHFDLAAESHKAKVGDDVLARMRREAVQILERERRAKKRDLTDSEAIEIVDRMFLTVYEDDSLFRGRDDKLFLGQLTREDLANPDLELFMRADVETIGIPMRKAIVGYTRTQMGLETDRKPPEEEVRKTYLAYQRAKLYAPDSQIVREIDQRFDYQQSLIHQVEERTGREFTEDLAIELAMPATDAEERAFEAQLKQELEARGFRADRIAVAERMATIKKRQPWLIERFAQSQRMKEMKLGISLEELEERLENLRSLPGIGGGRRTSEEE